MPTSCKCFARCEADCVCDYDWTPPEVTRLRHDIERHIAIASKLATENERLRAEFAEATAWRPISTAPVKGRVLLWRAHRTTPIVARFDAIYGEFEDEFGEHVYNVTHWMPLPAAPNEIDAAMAGGEQ